MSLKIETLSQLPEADWTAFGKICGAAFNFPWEKSLDYQERVGREHIRVARVRGQIAGGLAAFPLSLYFAGRPVAGTGISIVCTAPEYRSDRVATQLLHASLREQYNRGLALSSLYPATVPVYRRCGYEMAGMQFEITLQTAEINVREPALTVRRETPEDADTLAALYTRWVVDHPGNCERGPFLWHRVRDRHGMSVSGYLIERDGVAEGAIFLGLASKGTALFDNHVRVTDVTVLTPAAARRALALIADHRSMAKTAWMLGSPSEPFLAMLPERSYKIESSFTWMLRIVNLPAALSQRAYPVGVSGELHLAVRDDVLPQNQGNFVLTVENGVGRVQPGGRGTFAIDIRGLASMYSSFMTAGQLAKTEYLSAPADELALAGTLFAGPMPWMRDPF